MKESVPVPSSKLHKLKKISKKPITKQLTEVNGQNKISISSNIKNSQTSTKKQKEFHLGTDEINKKILKLTEEINKYSGPEKHKMRKRLYYKISKLKKALENPKQSESSTKMDKIKKKQEKRIQKKILQAEEHKRLLKKQCLNCRKRGHEAKNCPDTELIKNGIDQNVQICYNCGRDNHNLKDCRKRRSDVLPFAVCFVCKETGHISRDCPKNDKGMYSKGGGCFICESVRHKASECPNNPVNQKRNGKFIQKKEKKEINNEEVESEVNENAGEELEPEIDEEF